MGLADEIRGYPCLDSIVLVDNCSTDDSWEQLKTLRHTDKVHVLRTEENGGYGMGNQAGINYAVEFLEADYIIIANPDIHVTSRCIERVKQALDNTEGAVMASARVTDRRKGSVLLLDPAAAVEGPAGHRSYHQTAV